MRPEEAVAEGEWRTSTEPGDRVVTQVLPWQEKREGASKLMNLDTYRNHEHLDPKPPLQTDSDCETPLMAAAGAECSPASSIVSYC